MLEHVTMFCFVLMCVIVKSLSSHSWPISVIQWACFLLGWALESRQHHILLCSNSVTSPAVSGLAINSAALVAICKTKINLLIVTCWCSAAYDLSEESVHVFCHLEVVCGSLLPVTSLQLRVVFVRVPHKMKHYNKCLCLLCCSTSRPDSLYDVTERKYPTDTSLTQCMVMVLTVTVYWGRSVCALLFCYVC